MSGLFFCLYDMSATSISSFNSTCNVVFFLLEFAASYSVLILRAVLMIFLVASMYPFSPMCIMVAQQAAMIPPGLEPAIEGEA